MPFKTHKRKKSGRMRGGSTHGHGARKKWKKSGHHGGCGMAGSGKRADHKKTLINKLYRNTYFGKQGVTSRRTQKKRVKIMNLNDIQKKFSGKSEIELKGYKILGDGEIKKPFRITAKEFSESAKEKIKKAGGEFIELKKRDDKKDLDEEDENSED